MTNLCQAIQEQTHRIAAAAVAANRSASHVRLMLATKTQSAETLTAALACGATLFGENRAQELVAKADAVNMAAHADGYALPTWHFIGHLQTNKVRDVVGRVACVQSVDRESLATALQAECVKKGVVLEVMIEINTSGEPSKHGVHPDEVWRLVDYVHGQSQLSIRGFMTIGALSEDEATVRRCFALLRSIGASYDATHGTKSELSMGMSHDLDWAIAEGSTMVRIGTAIFGSRTPQILGGGDARL